MYEYVQLVTQCVIQSFSLRAQTARIKAELDVKRSHLEKLRALHTQLRWVVSSENISCT